MPIKGDFISFSYNGVHSTELGIVHVSSSDRYADALLPTIQDKTVQAPGSDGTYFFGSYYTQRPITINIAFDSVTEAQLRKIRNIFGDKQSHNLVFDDEPYKVYQAKVTGTPQYNYICFGSPRVYKGEGTLTFTCYEPFAHTPNSNKYLSQYYLGYDQYNLIDDLDETTFNSNKTKYYIKVEDNYIQCTNESVFDENEDYYIKEEISNNPSWYKYDNKDEWNLGANLLETQGSYDSYISNEFKLYNPGDLETDFKFIIPIPTQNGASFSITGIKVYNNQTLESRQLNASISSAKEGDAYIQFNSKTNLIEGLNVYGARTENLYNESISSGSWFKIPLTTDGNWYFQPLNYSGINPVLKYDYLYF